MMLMLLPPRLFDGPIGLFAYKSHPRHLKLRDFLALDYRSLTLTLVLHATALI